jgi:hypothetical protein
VLTDDTHAVLTPRELAALPEYSTTNPTGTTVGKLWKCDAMAIPRIRRTVPADEPPLWLVCEWVAAEPGYVRVHARTALVVPGDPRRPIIPDHPGRPGRCTSTPPRHPRGVSRCLTMTPSSSPCLAGPHPHHRTVRIAAARRGPAPGVDAHARSPRARPARRRVSAVSRPPRREPPRQPTTRLAMYRQRQPPRARRRGGARRGCCASVLRSQNPQSHQRGTHAAVVPDRTSALAAWLAALAHIQTRTPPGSRSPIPAPFQLKNSKPGRLPHSASPRPRPPLGVEVWRTTRTRLYANDMRSPSRTCSGSATYGAADQATRSCSTASLTPPTPTADPAPRTPTMTTRRRRARPHAHARRPPPCASPAPPAHPRALKHAARRGLSNHPPRCAAPANQHTPLSTPPPRRGVRSRTCQRTPRRVTPYRGVSNTTPAQIE